MVTVPEEVTRYLHAVTARVRDVFGDRVVGVYTTGSMALGDYRPGRSDIDLMAVVAGSPALDLRRSVAAQSGPQEGHLLDNAVLNGCRALSFARDHRWYAKVDAAERTLPTAGEFAPL